MAQSNFPVDNTKSDRPEDTLQSLLEKVNKFTVGAERALRTVVPMMTLRQYIALRSLLEPGDDTGQTASIRPTMGRKLVKKALVAEKEDGSGYEITAEGRNALAHLDALMDEVAQNFHSPKSRVHSTSTRSLSQATRALRKFTKRSKSSET